MATEDPVSPTEPAHVIDACGAVMRIEHGPVPEVLYHLTDSEGLAGILKARTLWASLATALNDHSEVAHGCQLAIRMLEERLNERAGLYESALITYLRDPSSASGTHRFEMDPLVVSFCGRCDKSGQWLHYGRSGRGVALGFSPAIAQSVRYDLIKVDYDEESQRERMAALIEVGEKALAEESPLVRRDRNIICRTAHIVSLHIPLLAIRMKHPSFYEEEEWRLLGHVMAFNGKREDITGDSTPLRFRPSGERLIPYEEVSFADGAHETLKEIVIGYSSPLAPDAVRLLARENQMNPRVSRSDVPVR